MSFNAYIKSGNHLFKSVNLQNCVIGQKILGPLYQCGCTWPPDKH